MGRFLAQSAGRPESVRGYNRYGVISERRVLVRGSRATGPVVCEVLFNSQAPAFG